MRLWTWLLNLTLSWIMSILWGIGCARFLLIIWIGSIATEESIWFGCARKLLLLLLRLLYNELRIISVSGTLAIGWSQHNILDASGTRMWGSHSTVTVYRWWLSQSFLWVTFEEKLGHLKAWGGLGSSSLLSHLLLRLLLLLLLLQNHHLLLRWMNVVMMIVLGNTD